MVEKDSAKGVESAEVIDVSNPQAIMATIARLQAQLGAQIDPSVPDYMIGVRLEDHEHDHEVKPPTAPKGKTGTWEPVQVAEGDAHHDHEQVWVQHHGLNNGHYAKGQLYRFVEDAK